MQILSEILKKSLLNNFLLKWSDVLMAVKCILKCIIYLRERYTVSTIFFFRQLMMSHRQALYEQLTAETDAAMTLHLACVILFHKFTQCIIHVPGKCVPQVVLFLKDHLEPEKFQELTTLQGNFYCLQTKR